MDRRGERGEVMDDKCTWERTKEDGFVFVYDGLIVGRFADAERLADHFAMVWDELRRLRIIDPPKESKT